MKKVIGISVLLLMFFLVTVPAAMAVFGNYGDLMVLYSPGPITDPMGIKAEREARNYEEALLHMEIPQYVMGERIRNEALVRGAFFYHTEICADSHEYTEVWGMNWLRYRFTDNALQLLSLDQVVAIQDWIVSDNVWRYKLPFDEVNELYVSYVQGHFNCTKVPIKLMICFIF